MEKTCRQLGGKRKRFRVPHLNSVTSFLGETHLNLTVTRAICSIASTSVNYAACSCESFKNRSWRQYVGLQPDKASLWTLLWQKVANRLRRRQPAVCNYVFSGDLLVHHFWGWCSSSGMRGKNVQSNAASQFKYCLRPVPWASLEIHVWGCMKLSCPLSLANQFSSRQISSPWDM